MDLECSELDRKRAIALRSLQKKIEFPSDNDLANAIDYNVIGKCQFNRRDICIVNKRDGRCIAELKRKLTKRKTKMKIADVNYEVPRVIMDAYSKIYLDIDIMYAAISDHIK